MKVPDTPYDAGLPPIKFKEWRPYQQDTVEKILNSDKKFLVLEAPCGFGKSPAAVAISNLFHKSRCERDSAPNHECSCGQHPELERVDRAKSKTIYVASTKHLQGQVLKDFPTAKMVKGRNNFGCPYKGNLVTAAECWFEAKGEGARKCPLYGECKYFVQRNAAMKARLSIHNYAFFLNAQRGCLFRDFDLLILDEAHTAENALMGFVAFKFTFNQFRFADTEFPSDNRQEALEVLEGMKFTLEGKIHVMEQKLTEDSDIRDLKELQRVKNLYRGIEDFLDIYEENWLFDHHKDKRTPKKSYIEFRPVWVDKFGHYLWENLREGGKVLLMSATIGDFPMFCKLLGIPEDQAEFLSLPSTFPVKNRRIIFRPVGRLSSKSYGQNREDMLTMAEKLAEEHSKEKGVVHTISYAIARDIEDNIDFKLRNRMVFPKSGDDKELVLKNFRKSKEPLILVSPAMGLGVDLEDDTARWQVIVKVPFAYLGDEQVRIRLHENEKWYRVDAANRCIQTAGRIVRSYEDYGVTYLLDTNFYWFFNTDPGIFPEWFREAVVVSKDRQAVSE